MAAYRRVYDSHHLQADCQEPGSAPEPYTLGDQIWANFALVIKYSGEAVLRPVSRCASEQLPHLPLPIRDLID